MAARPHDEADSDGSDPFREHAASPHRRTYDVLGGRFVFASASNALIAMADEAYAGLPVCPTPDVPPLFEITLVLGAERVPPAWAVPPPLSTHAGAGVLYGVIDASNHVVIAPAVRHAAITISPDMLDHPYHLRYELLEFAVFVLAARSMGLVPLHGACVGVDGHAVLLLGASGAGKSTLALLALEAGMQLIAEDAVFADPRTGRVAGVGNYVHLKHDSVALLAHEQTRRWIRAAPVIHRRSGVAKYEADLRAAPWPSHGSRWQLSAVVFVSADTADRNAPLLLELTPADALPCLAADQPYASRQPGWAAFVAQAAACGSYRLHRGAHPADALAALRQRLGAAAEACA